MIFSKLRKDCEQFRTQNTTNIWRKNAKIEYSNKKMAQKIHDTLSDWNKQLLHKWFVSRVQLEVTQQTYNVEERTFGTPCICRVSSKMISRPSVKTGRAGKCWHFLPKNTFATCSWRTTGKKKLYSWNLGYHAKVRKCTCVFAQILDHVLNQSSPQF